MVLAMVLAMSCFTVSAFAADDGIKAGVSFVNASALNMRSEPSMSGSVLDVAYRNEVVVIEDKVGDWYKVIYNLKEGYMHSDYLTLIDRENVELGYGKINAYCVNLRSGPSTSHSIKTQVYEGATGYIIGINCGWYKIIYNDMIAYVRSDLMDLTEFPYENQDSSNSPKFFRGGKSTGVAPSASALGNTTSSNNSTNTGSTGTTNNSGTTESAPSTNTGSSEAGQAIVECAKKYLGIPYVYGGSSTSGFDCSGLVQYVTRECGYSIARTASKQYNYGTYVEKEDLQPGDLVFFANTYTSGISHVGIYAGDGQFIHAPSTGDVVKFSSLNTEYYTSHYYGARRVY